MTPFENQTIDPTRNRLLVVLPKSERDRIFPHLELVSLKLGKSLYKSGIKLTYVYFPVTAIISLLSVMENGTSAEIAIIPLTNSFAAGCS